MSGLLTGVTVLELGQLVPLHGRSPIHPFTNEVAEVFADPPGAGLPALGEHTPSGVYDRLGLDERVAAAVVERSVVDVADHVSVR